MMYLVVFGRQDKLGRAELACASGIKPDKFSLSTGLIDIEPDIFNLGGTTRIAEVIERQPGQWFNKIQPLIISHIKSNLPAGKHSVGLSVIDGNIKSKQIKSVLLDVKKALKNDSVSARAILPKLSHLNAAEVLRNRLTADKNAEYLYVQGKDEAILARTKQIQNIDSYSQRDYGRPARDAYVGMLPPKLAQIMVNLATGQLDNSQKPLWILDPFCGTGVVLQEALLIGHNVYGTDLESRMINMTLTNLEWLKSVYNLSTGSRYELEQGDAVSHSWTKAQPINAVVSEIYLGPPLDHQPSPQELDPIRSGVNLLLRKFLSNIKHQISSGTPLVLAVPAWKIGNVYSSLEVIDQIEDLGYTYADLPDVSREDLMYYRKDQIVARQLLVILRK
jgi:tRNA G10  N-methylase Trm11